MPQCYYRNCPLECISRSTHHAKYACLNRPKVQKNINQKSSRINYEKLEELKHK